MDVDKLVETEWVKSRTGQYLMFTLWLVNYILKNEMKGTSKVALKLTLICNNIQTLHDVLSEKLFSQHIVQQAPQFATLGLNTNYSQTSLSYKIPLKRFQ